MTELNHSKRSARALLLVAAMLALAALACVGGNDATQAPAPTQAPVVVPPTEAPAEQPASGISLFVINNSGLEICYLYVSPTTSDSWGDDQLGEDTIPSGSSYEIFDVPAGQYDLRAEACDGVNFAENYGADLSSGDFEWTITPGGPALTIVNSSDRSICEVYFSERTNPSWGIDRLEEELAPGDSVTYSEFEDGLHYDVLVHSCGNNIINYNPNDITMSGAITLTLLNNGEFQVGQ